MIGSHRRRRARIAAGLVLVLAVATLLAGPGTRPLGLAMLAAIPLGIALAAALWAGRPAIQLAAWLAIGLSGAWPLIQPGRIASLVPAVALVALLAYGDLREHDPAVLLESRMAGASLTRLAAGIVSRALLGTMAAAVLWQGGAPHVSPAWLLAAAGLALALPARLPWHRARP